MMNELYKISSSKLFCETIGNDRAHNWNAFSFENINVKGEKMDVFFCKNEKGMFVVAGMFEKGSAYHACGHWHSGKRYYKIYFRRNFSTKEEGNEFYKRVKATMVIA